MATLITPVRAIAYLNHGRWIADCPTGCNSAMEIRLGQTAFLCGMWIDTQQGRRFVGGCAATADIEWPPDVEAIAAAMAGRPPQHQHWAPAGHRQTHTSHTPGGELVADAYPGGQTAADILAERI